MKRNKPFCKVGDPGTQSRRRQPYWSDERRTEDWVVIAPQSVVGDAKTFSLEGAVPAGIENRADDPSYASNLYRWLVNIDGRSVMVFASWGSWWFWSDNADRFRDAPRGDVWHAFTAPGKCERPKCPLTRFFLSDRDFEVPRHRPGHCPLGLPTAATWKRVGRVEL